MTAKDLKAQLEELKKKGYKDRELRSYAAAARSWEKKGSKEYEFWDQVAKEAGNA